MRALLALHDQGFTIICPPTRASTTASYARQALGFAAASLDDQIVYLGAA